MSSSSTETTRPSPPNLSPRDQAAAWSLTLSRVSPAKPLTKDNALLWLSKIQTSVKSLQIIELLESDVESKGSDSATRTSNAIIRSCLVSWMLSNMDEENEIRFRDKITTYNSTNSIVQDLPSKLWKSIDTFYIDRSAEVQLLLKNSLDIMKQSNEVTLSDYLDTYNSLVVRYKHSGGKIPDDELGRKLLGSLNQSRLKDARDILRAKIVNYDEVVAELRRYLNDEALLGIAEHVPSSIVTYSPEASVANFLQCTPSKCYGYTRNKKHTIEECFKRPGNEAKYDEWVDQKKRSGKWEDRPIAATAIYSEPTIAELEASFNRMNT